ncbi:hypothetical protein KFE98_19415 [bacterium SCSIO 12741]|nr:hypothetical protein KFE98_19415 [bacterium SCSIO 12741]
MGTIKQYLKASFFILLLTLMASWSFAQENFILRDSIEDYAEIRLEKQDFNQVFVKLNILNELFLKSVKVKDTALFYGNSIGSNFRIDTLEAQNLIIQYSESWKSYLEQLRIENKVDISGIEGKSIEVHELFAGGEFNLSENYVMDLYLRRSTVEKRFMCFGNEVIGDFYLDRLHFHSNAEFTLNEVDSSLIMIDCDFSTSPNLSFDGLAAQQLTLRDCQLPDTLTLKDLVIENQIDLSQNNVIGERNTPCVLVIDESVIGKLKLRYSNFQLLIPEELSSVQFEQYSYLFETLLSDHQEYGFMASYETLDKDYQRFKLSQNPNDSKLVQSIGKILSLLNEYWNGYGYEKERIWFNSFFLIFLFGLINWILFPFLISEVYPIKAIAESNNRLVAQKINRSQNVKHFFLMRNPYMVFFYTCLIFFGLKISVENLKFDHKISVVYILLQYTMGLICLAYMANFVISSSLIGS